MMTTIYGISNCDTVKKARRWLDEQGIDYTFFDFKKNQPTLDQLNAWVEAVSLDVLLNKRGTTWRKLTVEEQQKADDLEGAIALMQEHTSLIKRPVIEHEGRIAVGFKPDSYQAFFNL